MVNYQNGKIYKIVSQNTDKIYIGSTCVKTLGIRFSHHKTHYDRYNRNLSSCISSFEILNFPDACIELIETFPCTSKIELLTRETYFIDLYKNICVVMLLKILLQVKKIKKKELEIDSKSIIQTIRKRFSVK